MLNKWMLAGLLLWPSVALAADAQCGSLNDRYRKDVDQASRFVALANATSGSVSGAIQSAIETRQANALAMMKIDIDLLKATGCKIPAVPIAPEKYEGEANGCKIRLIMSQFGGGVPASACDAMAWVGTRKP